MLSRGSRSVEKMTDTTGLSLIPLKHLKTKTIFAYRLRMGQISSFRYGAFGNWGPGLICRDGYLLQFTDLPNV